MNTGASETHNRSLHLAMLESLETLHQFAQDCEDVTAEYLVECIGDIINDAKFLEMTAGGM